MVSPEDAALTAAWMVVYPASGPQPVPGEEVARASTQRIVAPACSGRINESVSITTDRKLFSGAVRIGLHLMVRAQLKLPQDVLLIVLSLFRLFFGRSNPGALDFLFQVGFSRFHSFVKPAQPAQKSDRCNTGLFRNLLKESGRAVRKSPVLKLGGVFVSLTQK